MTQNQKIIDSVKDIYNQIGQTFSATRQYLWPDLKPFLKNIPANASVLDVGCGNGRLLTGLPSKIKYTGIDISTTLLTEAKKQFPKHQFIETDITKPDIWKHLPKYDYIFSIAAIHHLPDTPSQKFLLEQIQKHLKPNGKVLITAWNLWQPKYLKHQLDLKTKLKNLHWVYIPFQNKKRFCYTFTSLNFYQLLHQTKFNLKIKKTPQNYLLHNFKLAPKIS